jgi:AcrR family transcriptional regulator
MVGQPEPANINPPLQSRSRRTLERIVAASFEILATEGPAGLTVHRVVEKAESSVGSFYARFDGKDDLLDYLGERVWTEALERWNRAVDSRDWGTAELPGLVRGSVTLLVDAQRSRSVYLKSLDQISGRRANAYDLFRVQVLEGVAALLLGRASEMTHSQPTVAVRIGLGAVMGVLDAENRVALERLDREVLIDECSSLLLAYLAGTEAGEGDAAGVEFFDVWS